MGEQKQWMHLPYAFHRGDFDWHYTTSGPSAEERFQVGWRFYHGIDGSRKEADMRKARESCLAAAKRGHFLARALCYREGWGRFQQDDGKALADFTAAADAGRSEGKCRLGISLCHAVNGFSANFDRGLALLREAAGQGEVEAMYRLGLHEQGFDDQ